MNCRFCDAPLTSVVLDLGLQPSANRLLTAEALEAIKGGAPEHMSPLTVMFCDACTLVQLSDTQPPAELFRDDYFYYSSFSESWVQHARAYVEYMTGRFGFGPESMIFEVGSNDGYLLQHFVGRGIPCIGIDPAAKAAEEAKKRHVNTLVGFFGSALTDTLLDQHGPADLILGNNVFAHVPTINDFVASLKKCLKPDGIVTFEFPHLARMIEFVQFDTIYDEHYFYYSLGAVEKIFARHGMRIFDVQELPTHGGSLRIFGTHDVSRHRQAAENLDRVRGQEAEMQLDRSSGFDGFRGQAERIRDDFLAYVGRARENGKRVAAYGAAAKGTVFLNYCDAGPDIVEFVVDDTPAKQDRYLPGIHIPIVSATRIDETPPEIVIILPWNLRSEITGKLERMGSWKGTCVSFIPKIAETIVGG